MAGAEFLLGVLEAYIAQHGRRSGTTFFDSAVMHAKLAALAEQEKDIPTPEEILRQKRASDKAERKARWSKNAFGDDFFGDMEDGQEYFTSSGGRKTQSRNYKAEDTRREEHARTRTYAPNPAPDHWSTILGVAPDATKAQVQKAWRKAAAKAHPDTPGGSHDQMVKVNAAKDRALRECRP